MQIDLKILADVERIHIWRRAGSVQLNVQRVDSSGWQVATAQTLEKAWRELFTSKKSEEVDPLS